MLPIHLFTQLSPVAAKIYLLLLSLTDPRKPIPAVTIDLPQLAKISDLSERSCSRALRRLRNLALIHVPRHRYHAPATYVLLRPRMSP